MARKKVAVSSDGRLTSDGGILLLAQIERRLGIAERLARCIENPRDPACVDHSLAEMIRFRTLLVVAGYPGGNDCDVLRNDPAFKLAQGGCRKTARTTMRQTGKAMHKAASLDFSNARSASGLRL